MSNQSKISEGNFEDRGGEDVSKIGSTKKEESPSQASSQDFVESIPKKEHLGPSSILSPQKLLELVSSKATGTPVTKVSPSKSTLATLLLFLKNNNHYDPLLCLCLAAQSWRWETLQYLSTARGLHLEKLCALLSDSALSMDKSSSEDGGANSVSDSQSDYWQSCFDPSSGLYGQYNALTESRRNLLKEQEPGYLHCFSDPELRSVLLVYPRLAASHANKVLELLPSLSAGVLSRLAALYDPSHPVIIPFLSSSKKWGSVPPITLQYFSEVFLKILIALNKARGWVYCKELVNFVPSVTAKVNFN